MAKEKMITRVVSESVVKVTWYDDEADCLVYSEHLIPDFESIHKPAEYISTFLASPVHPCTYVKHAIIETKVVKYVMPLRVFCAYGVREDTKVEI